MNGYSKIKSKNTSKSRSMDLSDLLSFPENPKLIEKSDSIHTSKAQETKQIKTTNSSTHETPSEPEEEDDGINGERFGVILSRNCSVSSPASQRFRFDKQSTTTTLQSAVKRALSMRRSSSVSERYCRIHDQCVTLVASPLDDDGDDAGFEGMDDNTMQTRSVKKQKQQQHRTAKILKACKRLIGL